MSADLVVRTALVVVAVVAVVVAAAVVAAAAAVFVVVVPTVLKEFASTLLDTKVLIKNCLIGG